MNPTTTPPVASTNPSTQGTGSLAGMDIGAVNLAKAIRQTESGGNFNAKGASGESGAYQWTPATWQAHATQILGDPKAPMTPANQNAVAYGVIKSWKDSGLNAAQIAAKWNSGSENNWENKIGVNSQGISYNVPAYVKSVTDAYQTIKSGGNVGADPNNPSSTGAVQPVTPDNSGALFPSSPNDNGFVAGLKSIGNIPGSAFNFTRGLLSSLNPLNTLKNIGDIVSQVSQSTPGELIDTVTGLPKASFKSLVPQGVQQLVTGDIAGAAKSFTNDPFGQTAPIVLATLGAAKLADTYAGGLSKAADNGFNNFQKTGINVMPQTGVFTDALNKGISNTAKAVSPITSLATIPLGWASGIATSAASHFLGLEPDTMATIANNKEAFSKIAQDQASRGGLANEFGTAIDHVETTLQDTGAGYNPIRSATAPVAVPENFIPDVLNKFGLKVDQGVITADTKSITRNPADIKALQNFVDNWGNKTELTPDEYLNMRKDIAGIAKFGRDLGTNSDAQTVGTALYAEANRTIRPQIKGLKELDNTYSPIKQQFDQIKKDFLQKGTDGEYIFKDGAINKINNATGVGKDALLARMESVMPGITKKIQILKAIEDIRKSRGNKVGNYTRAIIEGGAFVGGHPIGAIIAAIVSNPSIAVPLLRGLGYGTSAIAPVISALKVIAGDINNLKVSDPQKGAIESPYMNPKIGFGNGIQLTLEQANELRSRGILKLPAPASSIQLGGAKDASQVIMIKAGKIVNQMGDVVGYSSTGNDIKVKGTDTPYTKTDELPVIQFGKKAVPTKSNLPTAEGAPNVAMPVRKKANKK